MADLCTEIPRRVLAPLGRDECLALLSSVPVGQVVFTYRALPDVLPVNFRVDGESVVIRVAAGSRLGRGSWRYRWSPGRTTGAITSCGSAPSGSPAAVSADPGAAAPVDRKSPPRPPGRLRAAVAGRTTKEQRCRSHER
ncbi:pyridoxamine 5'-phosphate oxidase family protein [Cryptosporangium sp. NPDC051539]|uniref:pyridoxamine 5'-phosphate oxidase family protein n=1 Tax=Cryptosporangium sp. NPDC051539 TaxID=3363962 RepID=UPI0037A0DD57